VARISACIISFNEEDKIEDCLRSLQPVADEIIVVDSLSTDATVEIARRYTSRIFSQAFLGHIEQKNLAVSKASHDWILSLDCDERLDAELAAAILGLKERLDEDCVYRMARRTFYIYRWLNHCWYPDRKIRLFHRRRARWGGVNPHDRVDAAACRTIDLPGNILHYSYDSLGDHLRTVDRFSEIAAGELLAADRPVRAWEPFTHGAAAFLRLYLLQRGFLDGFAGFSASFLSAVYAYAKYAKVLTARWREASRSSG